MAMRQVFLFFLCHWWTWYIRDKLITQSTFLSINLSFPIILLYDHLIFSWILSNILFLTCDFYFFKKFFFFQIDSDNYKIKQTRLAYKHEIKIMILVCLFDFYWFLPVCLMNLKIKQNVMILWKKVQKKNQFSFLKS